MRFISFCLLLLSVVLTGCSGKDGPEKVTVTGEVTFNGDPLPEGEIIFRGDSGKGAASAGKIKDGKYTLECTLGSKRVEIRAMRVKPGSVAKTLQTGESGENLEQYIPVKYNDKTTLKADVKPEDGIKFDFQIERKGKRK
jgi:hypothetical protein